MICINCCCSLAKAVKMYKSLNVEYFAAVYHSEVWNGGIREEGCHVVVSSGQDHEILIQDDR
jgi:hypothetical protein